MIKHLTKKGYTFWYRRRMGKKGEIVFSLGTKNYDLAMLRHSYIDYKINQLIHKGALETMDTAKIREIIDGYKEFVKSDEFIYGDEGKARDKALAIEIDGEFFGGHTKTALMNKLSQYGKVSQSDDISKVKEHTEPITERNAILKKEYEKLDNEQEQDYFHWKVLKAEVWALNKAIKKQEKNFGAVEKHTQIMTQPIPSQNQDISINELTKKYIAELSKSKEWGGKNERDIKYVLGIFEEYFSPRTANELRRDDFVEFRDKVLAKLPARPNQNAFKDKTLKEILEMTYIIKNNEKKKIDYIILSTLNKHIGRIHQVFFWAADKAHLIEKNYCSDLRIKPKNKSNAKAKKTKTIAWTNEELKLWFEVSPYFTKDLKKTLINKPQNVWIPLIALYLGGRNAELTQLHHRDIKKINDIWCIKITDITDNPEERKQVKGGSSLRTIPIAQGLIDLGFLDYVKQQRGKLLFPNVKYYGDSKEPDFTTRVSEYIRKHISQEKNKKFMSFRNLVNQKLKNKKTPVYIINDIIGHSEREVDDNPIDNEVYGDEQMPVNILKEVIDNCLVYDEIDFSHIKKAINELY